MKTTEVTRVKLSEDEVEDDWIIVDVAERRD